MIGKANILAIQAATSTAMTDLPPSHPIRLGLALNFSVFYYEIMNSSERSVQTFVIQFHFHVLLFPSANFIKMLYQVMPWFLKII